MKAITAIKEGFGITHKGWRLLLLLFVIYLIFVPFNFKFASDILSEMEKEGARPSLKIGFTECIWLVFSFLIYIFIQSGILAFARNAIKERSVKLDKFLENCKRYFPRLLGLTVLLFGLMFLVVVIGAVSFVIVAFVAGLLIKKFSIPNWIGVIPIFLFLIAFIILLPYLLVVMSFPNIILVAKDGRIFRSILDSIKFVRKKFWRITWFLTIIGLIFIAFYASFILLTFLVGLILNLNVNAFAGFIFHFAKYGLPPKSALISYLVINSIFQAYIGIFWPATFMSYYLGNANEVAPEQVGAA